MNYIKAFVFPEIKLILRLCTFSTVSEHLNLKGLQFFGTIPHELGRMDLQVLELDNNDLSGSIPLQLGGLSNLRTITLKKNQIEGIIPVELSNCKNLTEIDFSMNRMTGTIPSELFEVGTLEKITLNTNQFSGQIPSNINHGLKHCEYLIHIMNLSEIHSNLIFVLFQLKLTVII